VIICHNARVKEGRGAGEADPTRPVRRRSGSGEAEEGEGKEGERIETDWWGRRVSERKEKRKRRRRRGLLRGGGTWAAGPLGQKVSEVSFLFSFSFSNSFQINLLDSNSNQTFLNFSHNFYKLFKPHTSNQNHA
jgi:hypothetical protein